MSLSNSAIRPVLKLWKQQTTNFRLPSNNWYLTEWSYFSHIWPEIYNVAPVFDKIIYDVPPPSPRNAIFFSLRLRCYFSRLKVSLDSVPFSHFSRIFRQIIKMKCKCIKRAKNRWKCTITNSTRKVRSQHFNSIFLIRIDFF